MKIFITGANGFIGQHIKTRLEEQYIIGELTEDLREYDKVEKQVKEFDPDIIIHLAARTEVQDSFYEQIAFSEINYVGTVNLIEIAATLPNLKNFLFASTMEVYGWQPISELIKNGKKYEIIAFDESTSPNPNAPYAVSKYACEKYLEYAYRSYGLPFTAIRQTNTYGRKDNNFFVIEQIVYQMLTNSKEINLGNSEPYRNFIYIEDLLDLWEETVKNSEKCRGEIFCIGPNNAIQIKELVNMIAEKLNWTGKVNWNTKPKRPGEIYLLNSTNNKVTEKLGWEPTTSISDGLDLTINFWKKKINTDTNLK